MTMPRKEPKGIPISIRFTEKTLDKIDRRIEITGQDRTSFIREAIAQYLELPANTYEQRIIGLELGSKLVEQELSKINQRIDFLDDIAQ